MNVMKGKSSYLAMLSFMDKMHLKFGWNDLGPLLGSMALVDGMPLDTALIEDWEEAIECARSTGEINELLTGSQGYVAMLYFMQQMYECKRTNIKSLINDMTLVKEMPLDNNLVKIWEEAVDFSKGNNEPKPYLITKNGATYEVHRSSK